MVHFYTSDEIAAQGEALNSTRGACYRAETKFIASLTGNEVPEGKRDYFKAVRYINRASHLGLNAFDEEVMGRMATGLGRGTRFAGDPVMNAYHGEEAATHSFQGTCQIEKELHQLYRGESDKAAALQTIIPLRQYACLGMLMHDMGEICGEAGYARGDSAGVRFTGDFNKEEMEEKILRRVLNWAIASVEQGESREAFASKLTGLTRQLDINGKATRCETLSRDELTAALDNPANAERPLGAEGDVLYRQLLALWQMVEKPLSPVVNKEGISVPEHSAFIGYFTKAIEHLQGTRHLLRFARRDAAMQEQGQNILGRINEQRILGGLAYNEAELASLFAATPEGDAMLQKLARIQRDHSYGCTMQFLDETLNATRRADIARAAGDEDAGHHLSQHYLKELEALHTVYELAIEQDRIPPKGERSLGQSSFAALREKTAQKPQMLVEAIEHMGQRERLASGIAA